ncbi:MAG: RHS repeat-associated core domain-containing protein [Candidatus Omnitrophica bacterium]|nr:RHS repeat-associated core domain-containing protein [Candidatus Omnitrophota bacterium]
MQAAVLSDDMAYVTDVQYNVFGQATQTTYGNGTVTTNTYDSTNGRLMGIKTVDASNTTLQDLHYTYDSIGNILTIVDNKNTASQTFQYDELNRLVTANGATYGAKTYDYDKVGNIESKDGKVYSYAENGAGPHAVTSLSDGSTYSYDLNGNMKSKTVTGSLTSYSYSTENRLTSVVKSGATIAQYTYDGDGGRTRAVITTAGQSATTVSIGSIYEETAGIPTRNIFLGGQRVASVSATGAYFYLTDHLGGTNVLTDSTGVKKELIEYDPFGSYSRHEKYGTSDEVARFYFTGKKLDGDTGLYFFEARFYDPSLGRFITPDTLIQSPSNPQTFNRYSYCGNNPVNRIDPSGHKWSWTKFWHAAVGAIVGVTAAILLGPVALGGTGFFATAWGAAAFGGALGGAITGGLDGGWKGALIEINRDRRYFLSKDLNLDV